MDNSIEIVKERLNKKLKAYLSTSYAREKLVNLSDVQRALDQLDLDPAFAELLIEDGVEAYKENRFESYLTGTLLPQLSNLLLNADHTDVNDLLKQNIFFDVSVQPTPPSDLMAIRKTFLYLSSDSDTPKYSKGVYYVNEKGEMELVLPKDIPEIQKEFEDNKSLAYSDLSALIIKHGGKALTQTQAPEILNAFLGSIPLWYTQIVSHITKSDPSHKDDSYRHGLVIKAGLNRELDIKHLGMPHLDQAWLTEDDLKKQLIEIREFINPLFNPQERSDTLNKIFRTARDAIEGLPPDNANQFYQRNYFLGKIKEIKQQLRAFQKEPESSKIKAFLLKQNQDSAKKFLQQQGNIDALYLPGHPACSVFHDQDFQILLKQKVSKKEAEKMLIEIKKGLTDYIKELEVDGNLEEQKIAALKELQLIFTTDEALSAHDKIYQFIIRQQEHHQLLDLPKYTFWQKIWLSILKAIGSETNAETNYTLAQEKVRHFQHFFSSVKEMPEEEQIEKEQHSTPSLTKNGHDDNK